MTVLISSARLTNKNTLIYKNSILILHNPKEYYSYKKLKKKRNIKKVLPKQTPVANKGQHILNTFNLHWLLQTAPDRTAAVGHDRINTVVQYTVHYSGGGVSDWYEMVGNIELLLCCC